MRMTWPRSLRRVLRMKSGCDEQSGHVRVEMVTTNQQPGSENEGDQCKSEMWG